MSKHKNWMKEQWMSSSYILDLKKTWLVYLYLCLVHLYSNLNRKIVFCALKWRARIICFLKRILCCYCFRIRNYCLDLNSGSIPICWTWTEGIPFFFSSERSKGAWFNNCFKVRAGLKSWLPTYFGERLWLGFRKSHGRADWYQ